jgi:uncharacterized protein
MAIMEKLFGVSPFGPLVDHAKLVHECVKLIEPLTEAILDEQFDTLDDWHNKIAKAEHQADLTKREIRRHLGKRYWLPVDRTDLLRLLHQQDGIADAAEDLAVIANLRRTRVPPIIHSDLREYVRMVLSASRQYLSAAEEIGSLAEAGFSGRGAENVLEATEEINTKEWEVDRFARHMIQKMFTVEQELNPMDIMFSMKIIEALGAVANHAENTGESLALMILRR